MCDAQRDLTAASHAVRLEGLLLLPFVSQQQPSAGRSYPTEDHEATADMVRYVGRDSNVHLKSLKSELVSVTGVGVSAAPLVLVWAEVWSWVLAVCSDSYETLLNTCVRPEGAA